jgi:hypothetical protein
MSEAVTPNPISAGIENIISIIATQGADAAKVYIATSPAGFLEGPVIDIFTNEVIDAIESSLESYTSQIVSAVVNDVEVNGENSTVRNASKALAVAQASGDAAAIKAALEKTAAAAVALGKFNGS